MQYKNLSLSLIALAAFCFASSVNATIVEIETNQGTFEVNLYDLGTPDTVANFLNYVDNGAYSESFMHRSVPGFIVQGGGFVTDMDGVPSAIPENATVDNEPTYSNVRGTIAMAKTAAGPSTATSQWFFNLANNAANLDDQNGGFTVFGQVTGDGMDVVDAIAALQVYDQGGVYSEIPLQNYTVNTPVVYANLIVITEIRVLSTDANSAGAAGLNPVLSTANNGGDGGGGGGGGGGGSFGLFGLLCLSALGRRRYRIAKAA